MKRMTPDVARQAIGVQKDGRLSKCPGLPNCVVSQHQEDPSHHMDAMSFQRDGRYAFERLLQVVQRLPRTKVVAQESHYLHVEFKSALLGFVDDVEFLLDEKQKKIHFRSASRLGVSDLGANKKRMKLIKRLFSE